MDGSSARRLEPNRPLALPCLFGWKGTLFMSQEVVQMKARGFICVNAHPAGCARNVEQQVETVKRALPRKLEGVRNVLVIGASTGYGLASRIAAAWGFQARTVG